MPSFSQPPKRIFGIALFLFSLCWAVTLWGLPTSSQADTKAVRQQEPQPQEVKLTREPNETDNEYEARLRLLRDAGVLAQPAAGTGSKLKLDPKVPPSNDICSGAEVVPAAGPFPYLTALTNMAEATSTGDPAAPSCGGTTQSFSTWYTFTPNATGSYRFSLGGGGTPALTGTQLVNFAPAPTFTSASAQNDASFPIDTVMTIYSSPGGCAGPFTQVACDDDAGPGAQSEITSNLTAGTQYFVLAYLRSATPVVFPFNGMQLFVTTTVPVNDTCANAQALTLNQIAVGETTGGTNDFSVASNDPAWTTVNGNVVIGNLPTTTPGNDVLYSFTAPNAGNYTFTVFNAQSIILSAPNPAIYLVNGPACPAPGTVSMLAGANRSTVSERISNFPMTAGQTVYLVCDGVSSGTAGDYAFYVQVTQNTSENETTVQAINETPGTASTLSCGIEGFIGTTSDVDFYALPAHAANSRLFAMVSGAASSTSGEFDLRVTTTADTLESDSSDNDNPFGGSSPNVAGTILPAGSAFLSISNGSITPAVGAPYQIYSVIQPPIGSATTETAAANNLITDAGVQTGNYFSGTMSSSTDSDLYRFTANAGDVMFLSLDTDPLKDNTPFNGRLDLLDANGNVLSRVNDSNGTSSLCFSCTGTLTASTPNSPAEGILFTALATGTYYARVSLSTGTAGDYLLSISTNCQGVSVSNTAPTFTPAAALSRQQGSTAGAAVTVGTASDVETPAGSLTVTQIAGGTATGITVTGITNTNGTVSAVVTAGCTATSGTVRFQVTDAGALTGTGDLQVNVTPNAGPTLTYGNTSVNANGSTTVNPATGPTDNGTISSITVQSQGTYTGTISVNNSSGVVSISNAGPVGTHTIIIRATDNCGANTDATFQLTVNPAGNTPPTIQAGGPVTSQQGSAGAGATIATVTDDAGNGTVTVTATTVPTGITVTGITNTNGTITATVAALCNATVGNNTVVLTATDTNNATATANLTVNVTVNTAPTLTYAAATVATGGSRIVSPATGPSDNGSVAGIAVQSQGTFTGTVSVNSATGVVTVANAGPNGTHTITIRATDNCGTTTDATISLTVAAATHTVTQFYPVASTSGKTLTITGTGFVAGQTQVFFGEDRLIPATVGTVTATTITVTVPASSTGAGNVNGYLTIRVNGVDVTTLSLPANAADPSNPAATFPEFILWGDVTRDGLFGTNDVALARAFLQFQATPTARQTLAVDVIPANANGSRGNGQLTTTDFSFLRAVSFGQAQF
ncbi:MAG: pre-peptidase C-terminal domain-containing protein [Blastocatellia bacterium]|nr:pre-peptidase C-terminal domain-containing protein [Blastocatellia bacterium]